MYIQRNRWRLNRRTFLRTAGLSIALPWLEAMGEHSTSVANAGKIGSAEIPRRAFFANIGFFEAGAGIPKDEGPNCELTPWLSAWQDYRKDFTLFSGLSLYTGGHGAECCLLTGMNSTTNGVKLPSVDQQIADYYLGQTRVPYLVLGTHTTNSAKLSWTNNKTPIATEASPKAVFDRLFFAETPEAQETSRRAFHEKQSVIDLVKEQARQLNKRLGRDDRQTVDQYLCALRNVEKRITIDRAWLGKDKHDPKKCLDIGPLDFGKEPPEKRALRDDDGTGMRTYLHLMFDIIALAFWSDSTRVVTFEPVGGDIVFKDKTKCPTFWHALTHGAHGERGRQWWAEIDEIYMSFYAHLIGRLKTIKEGQGTLLDHTMTAWSTCCGAGGHGRTNLPVLLCGGSGLGIKHQGHVRKPGKKLGSVWETMLQCLPGMKKPANFQGGQTDGVFKEVL